MRLDLVTRVVAAVAGWCLATATYAVDLLVPQEYASIQAAVNASQNGDRVVLAPGTYNEQVTINAKSITILGSGGPNVTKIDRQNAGCHVFNVAGVTGSPVKFEALTITRCQGDAIRASSSLIEINNVRVTFGSRAVLLETNSTLNATAFQAIVMSAPGACVYINGPGGVANLSNCNLQDGGNTNGGALYCNSGNGQFIVEETLFALHTGVNAGSVFLVPGSSGTFTDCVWSNCEGGAASCVYGQGNAAVTIDGCTMLQNRGTCFYLESGNLVARDSVQDGSYNDYRYSLLRNNSGPTTVERVTSRSSWGYWDATSRAAGSTPETGAFLSSIAMYLVSGYGAIPDAMAAA